jgi:hypothetical protein
MKQLPAIRPMRSATGGSGVRAGTTGHEALHRAHGQKGRRGLRGLASPPVPEWALLGGPTPRGPGARALRRPSTETSRRPPVAPTAAPLITGAG